MAGLFSTLDLASRALMVTQRGVAVTSHNISNVDTPGYTRQRQVLEASHPIPDARGNIGTGVEQETIDRIHDPFIDRRLVQERSAQGSLDTQANTLSQIESILNEQGGEGLTTWLSDFFNGLQDLAAASEPNQPTERENVLARARLLTDSVQRIDRSLRDLQQSLDRDIRGTLPEINALTRGIADLNQEIAKLEVSAPANDLRDQRDELLRELAGQIDVEYVEVENGSITVFFDGGVPLVEGNRTAQLVAVSDPTNPFDPTFASVYYDDGSNLFDVTGTLGGGALGGLLRGRDTLVADAIRDLDATVYGLVTQLNAQHQAGADLANNPGGNFFVDIGAMDDAAASFSVEAAILADPSLVAAAEQGLLPAETAGNTENARLLANLRDTRFVSFQPGDGAGPATGLTQTILDQAAGYIARQGQEARSMQSARAQQEQVLLEIENRRDEISGVSLDEEVTNLIRLQAAFQANSRVISAVDRMLQELVEIL